MNKKDMSVTMSLTSYQEMEDTIERYHRLKKSLMECVDTSLYDNNAENVIRIHLDSLIPIIKSVLPYTYGNVGIQYDSGGKHD